MKKLKLILIIILVITVKQNFAQDIESQKSNVSEKKYVYLDSVSSFGTYLEDEIYLPKEESIVISMELKELPANYSKGFYNSNNYHKYRKHFKVLKNKIITWKNDKSNKKKYTITIPPLKPNRFYLIEVNYLDKSLYHVYEQIYKEGKYELTSDISKKKEWMKLVDVLSSSYTKFHLYYTPTIKEILDFKDKVDKINLDKISFDYLLLRKKALESFKVLEFAPPKYNKAIYDYALTVKKINKDECLKDAKKCKQEMFTQKMGLYKDYINIYNFYNNFLRREFESGKNIRDFVFLEKIDFLTESKRKKGFEIKNELVPNFLNHKRIQVPKIQEKDLLSTNTNSFSTAFKNVLVPDFGYVLFIKAQSNSTLTGGSPFVGVNISLTPVNKNTPYHLSDLSFSQRISLHTGVILESLKEENVREDFFNGMSLMVGFGYKIGTQSTRINIGGILYNDINQITGEKSIAIQPYVALSIDIEIRNWLSGFIPSFTQKLPN